jgi:hypothetical protein
VATTDGRRLSLKVHRIGAGDYEGALAEMGRAVTARKWNL